MPLRSRLYKSICIGKLMSKFHSLCVLFVSSLLCGCAGTGWNKAGATKADFQRDLYSCESQAASSYPVLMRPVGTGYQAPTITNCDTFRSSTTCTSQPGAYTPPPIQDVNKSNRSQHVSNCLSSMGYSFKLF